MEMGLLGDLEKGEIFLTEIRVISKLGCIFLNEQI